MNHETMKAPGVSNPIAVICAYFEGFNGIFWRNTSTAGRRRNQGYKGRRLIIAHRMGTCYASMTAGKPVLFGWFTQGERLSDG